MAHPTQRAAIPVDHVTHHRISHDVPEPEQHEQQTRKFEPQPDLVGVKRRKVHADRQANARNRQAERGEGEHAREGKAVRFGL